MPRWSQRLPPQWRDALRRMRSALLSLDIPARCDEPQSAEEVAASREMSVVVAIHDAPEVLYKCLTSLEKYAANAEVILVDDASEKPETRAILEAFAGQNQWRTIRHETAQGHSRSCEAGAQLATRRYLCLLNSDTYVTPWSWDGAREAFEADPQIGVTGPSTSYTPTQQKMWRAEYCRHFWSGPRICAYAQMCAAGQPRGNWPEIPVAGGFAYFIRKQLWDELGGFDLNLPDYGNETELCRRVVKAGYRIVWTPRSYIHHYGQQSYGLAFGSDGIAGKSQEARRYIEIIHGGNHLG